jgi:hypothetical protein
MDQMPRDQYAFTGLAEPPDQADEFDEATEAMLKQTAALVADDKWHLVKKYWEAKKKYFQNQLTVELAGKDRNPELIGRLYMVSRLLEEEADAFITWVENNAKEVKKRDERRAQVGRANKS